MHHKARDPNHLVNIHPMTKKYPNGKRRSLGPSFFSSFFKKKILPADRKQSINQSTDLPPPFFSPFDKSSLTLTEPYPYPHTKKKSPRSTLRYIHLPAGSPPPTAAVTELAPTVMIASRWTGPGKNFFLLVYVGFDFVWGVGVRLGGS